MRAIIVVSVLFWLCVLTQSSVMDQNFQRIRSSIEELILKDWRLCGHEMTSTLEISVGSLEQIIHKEPKYKMVSARWVSKLLSLEQEHRPVQLSTQLLIRFVQEGKVFLNNLLTYDETWVHH